MRRPLTLISALLLSLLASCQKKTEEKSGESPLQIIPIPREVSRAPDQPLGVAMIIIPANASEEVRLAAQEINLRLEELGASPLRVAAAAPEGFDGRRIELSLAAKDDPKVPMGEQGYWIDSRDPRRVRLVGRDEQGLLWAAVTFRRLLVKGRDGKAALLGAEIRDWPDFPMRMMNRFHTYHRDHSEQGLLNAVATKEFIDALQYANGYAADSQQVVDFLLRLKHNLTWLPLYGLPTRYDAVCRAVGRKAKADFFFASLRSLTGYARARGVAFAAIETSNVGTSPEDDADADVARCVFLKSHKQYFCWSLDGQNRRKAEETAKFYAAAGYSMVALHSADGGGYTDPELWSARCAHCKERWGDDRAAADAHLFGIWRDAFSKFAPDISLAFIQYPYDASILLQPDHADYERVRDYWRALDAKLPPGVPVCVRENIRPAIEAFLKLFASRPLLVYWMTDTVAGDHYWTPLLSSRVRYARTFLGSGRPDWLIAYSSSCRPMAAIAAAQYLWNADSPGAGPWPGDLDVDRDGTGPPAFFEEMLPAFAAELFGPKAAPSLVDLFRGCISPSYCLSPGDVARLALVANTADRMQQQYDALVRACGGLERLWQRLETGERELLPADGEATFYGLSEQAGRARIWASYHLARMRTAEALRLGQPTPQIAAELAAAMQRVTADAAIARRMNARVRRRATEGQADFNRWLRKGLRERYARTDYAELLGDLTRLQGLLLGTVAERRETPAHARAVRMLLPDDGQGVTLRGKGATKLSLVPYPTQGESKTAVQVEGLTQPWHDGLSVGFPPADVAEEVEAGGVLRFYINGGGTGNQQLTFWLYARDGEGKTIQADGKDAMWVNLADYVEVDDLEATWQLVSIPLARLLRKGYTKVAGFGMNNAVHDEVCGPVWIDTMYVAADREPMEWHVDVQPPPEQPAATEARVLAVGVQPSAFIGASGPESRLMLGLKLLGNGSLTDVRITLRLLAPDGSVVRTVPIVSATRLRTPWWSASVRCDLGRLVPTARLEMVLSSNDVNETGAIQVKW